MRESTLAYTNYLDKISFGTACEPNEDEIITLEEKLAPWDITDNIDSTRKVHCCLIWQEGARLMLWGLGDPTGRGEGFSFIRVNAKAKVILPGESAEDHNSIFKY